MEHLSPDTLARLVDEIPSAEEGEHLRACATCVAELRGLREQTDALGRLPDLRPPPGDWEVLQARLVSDGLMEGRSRFRSMGRTPGWMKAAAAIVLFLVGTGAGAAWGSGALTREGSPGVAGPFLQASTGVVSVEEAEEAVRLAERHYMDAWVRYRQAVEAEGGEVLPDPATRIATLEYMIQAGQAALREAPTDPFLNGLVASAAAEREAVIRRASTATGESWY
ncbi:MAG: hypothetical protein PVI57_01535 [Gemmatimonadota bacterium]|jgi:hypothetical protein